MNKAAGSVFDKAVNGEKITRAEMATVTHKLNLSGPEEDWKRERAKIAKLQRQKMERTLVNVADLEEGLELITARIRKAAEAIGDEFGPKALSILTGAMDEVSSEIKRMFARER